jgi:hypothetical protein
VHWRGLVVGVDDVLDGRLLGRVSVDDDQDVDRKCSRPLCVDGEIPRAGANGFLDVGVCEVVGANIEDDLDCLTGMNLGDIVLLEVEMVPRCEFVGWTSVRYS